MNVVAEGINPLTLCPPEMDLDGGALGSKSGKDVSLAGPQGHFKCLAFLSSLSHAPLLSSSSFLD